MPRIRTIKPEFWTSEQVVDCSPTARLLFVGIWNFADDGGNHRASTKKAKMEVFPGDSFTDQEMTEWIGELLAAGLLVEYEAEGQSYWHVTGWNHQKIDKPKYVYPRPIDERSPNGSRTVDDSSPRKVREGKGKERKLARAASGEKEFSTEDRKAKFQSACEQFKPMRDRPDEIATVAVAVDLSVTYPDLLADIYHAMWERKPEKRFPFLRACIAHHCHKPRDDIEQLVRDRVAANGKIIDHVTKGSTCPEEPET